MDIKNLPTNCQENVLSFLNPGAEFTILRDGCRWPDVFQASTMNNDGYHCLWCGCMLFYGDPKKIIVFSNGRASEYWFCSNEHAQMQQKHEEEHFKIN